MRLTMIPNNFSFAFGYESVHKHIFATLHAFVREYDTLEKAVASSIPILHIMKMLQIFFVLHGYNHRRECRHKQEDLTAHALSIPCCHRMPVDYLCLKSRGYVLSISHVPFSAATAALL